jgi:hypothetical protein
MDASPEPIEKIRAIIDDQLTLEAHQRRKNREAWDIRRGRLEAYTKIVTLLTGTELDDLEVRSWHYAQHEVSETKAP